jgi:hypothetical protein
VDNLKKDCLFAQNQKKEFEEMAEKSVSKNEKKYFYKMAFNVNEESCTVFFSFL